MKSKSWALVLCLSLGSSHLLAALPGVELLRTDAPVMTPTGTFVGGTITSDPIYDGDGDLLKGELEVTFNLNGSASNSYKVNGTTIAPGGSETFVFDFDATGGRLNIPVSVDGTGTVSADDYELSIRVPGLVLWSLTPQNYNEFGFEIAFFGPDGLIWALVSAGAPAGPGIIKLDEFGNVVDSFALNGQGLTGSPRYVGTTPEGNVVIGADDHSVILNQDGDVIADYPYRIFEVLSDGTMYREAASADIYSYMRLGRLKPGEGQIITDHPENVWYDTRRMGIWGLTYTGTDSSARIRHVAQSGYQTIYYTSPYDGGSAKYGATSHAGGVSGNWVNIAGSNVFLNKDARAKALKLTELDPPSTAFNITDDGEWLLFYNGKNDYTGFEPARLIRIDPNTQRANVAEFRCESPWKRAFGNGASRNSKLLVVCKREILLIDLEAESKFNPWGKFIALDDITPDSENPGIIRVYYPGKTPTPLPSAGLIQSVDATYATKLTKE